MKDVLSLQNENNLCKNNTKQFDQKIICAKIQNILIAYINYENYKVIVLVL